VHEYKVTFRLIIAISNLTMNLLKEVGPLITAGETGLRNSTATRD
jgi:hypothetical protein